jgi:hypothetical protein
MDASGPPSASEVVGRFHAVLKSLEDFNNVEILPLIKGLLSPTDREHCFIATYYRAVANVRTLLTFTHTSHFQAISMLTRGLFELAVDIRLLGRISDSTDKMFAFPDWERLRAARNIVAFAKSVKADEIPKDLAIFETFIADKEATIEERRKELWPAQKRLNHWSGMNLRERVNMLKGPFDEIYNSDHPRLSWSVHSGLAGVINLEAEAFTAMCGVALKIAVDCYAVVLLATAAEMKIDKAVEKLEKKLRLAMYLPMTENREQANGLRDELLG